MARPIDPFREMERPFREMERLVNGLTTRATGTASMPMNLYREGDAFVAEVELPGVDPASIDVDVEERTLTVRAERKEDPAREDRRWLTRERSAGTFAHQLTLGEGLALDRIQADYSDGVLTLTIPVAEQAKPRKISVTHGGAAPVAAETVEGETAEASGE
ncbi:Hsp20/alpha crystallin family protein [Micrococcus luteus]|uniref:Hsp20/alpha crystallin family protein n=1 Tax=Micrococcus luteus TaxID=1270 RepID=UPI001CA78E1E|nr:Hsp20/alpha crystallin family protein [Micrococcus luteus]QZY83482.1 Hsp20/alpha crystallin family protein [Micrococcus luteus]